MKKNIFLIFVFIVLVCIIGFLFYKVNDLQKKVDNLQLNQVLDNANSFETESINLTNNEETLQNTTSILENEVNSKSDVKFNADKMKVAVKDGIYEETTIAEGDIFGLSINIDAGKAYISTNFENKDISLMYDNPKEVKNQEIKGFIKKPVMSFFAASGQDLNPPLIVFVLKDGSLMYADSEEMLKTENYVVKTGNLTGLNNIISFAYVSVSFEDGSGHISTVAIDKDGYAYDLFEILK